MKRSFWAKLAAAVALVLTMVGTQCRPSHRTQMINELRICGEVFEKEHTPLQKIQALVKLHVKGTQLATGGTRSLPFETVDNLSVGESVRLDSHGSFCTGVIKLDNYYKVSSFQILNLAVIMDGRIVEGRVRDGDLSGTEKNTLQLLTEFNYAKPYDAARMSRFVTEDAAELFEIEQRKLASKLPVKSEPGRARAKRAKSAKSKK
jgi:hypothetical protein